MTDRAPGPKRKARPAEVGADFKKAPGPWTAADTARLFAWAAPRAAVPPAAACERVAMTLNGLVRAAARPARRQSRRALADAARLLMREIPLEAEAWQAGTHPAQRWLLQPGPNRVQGAPRIAETGILGLLPMQRQLASDEAAAALRALDAALQRALPWLDLRRPGTADWHAPAYTIAREACAAWAEAGSDFSTAKETGPVVRLTATALAILFPAGSFTRASVAAAIGRFIPIPVPPTTKRGGGKSR